MVRGGREQQRVQALNDALGASLDLHQVLSDGYGLLLPLIGADYGALAVTRAEEPHAYEWMVQNLPPAFLGRYAEMAPHDFVHRAVMAKLNVVVRDTEMISRRALERNMMYHHAREVDSPIEQVMAVMLHVDGGFRSGLSLYRDRRRPFTEHERMLLQQLTPAIANAVRNCRMFGKARRWGAVLETLLGSENEAVVVVQPPGRELDRTAGATALLDAWFAPVERSPGALPQVLLDELAQAIATRALGKTGSRFWKREREEAYLEVEFFPVPEPVGVPLWALRFRAVAHVPAAWRERLTPREIQVTSGILRAWDNHLIGHHLGCGPATVKKHVQSILTKLGAPSCKMLQYRATLEA
jgi:Bacterial regulatory proteins, luxR family